MNLGRLRSRAKLVKARLLPLLITNNRTLDRCLTTDCDILASFDLAETRWSKSSVLPSGPEDLSQQVQVRVQVSPTHPGMLRSLLTNSYRALAINSDHLLSI